jgi:hypothetical protein
VWGSLFGAPLAGFLGVSCKVLLLCGDTSALFLPLSFFHYDVAIPNFFFLRWYVKFSAGNV